MPIASLSFGFTSSGVVLTISTNLPACVIAVVLSKMGLKMGLIMICFVVG
jgi:hypothetical protein